jgi:hypothetical protein
VAALGKREYLTLPIFVLNTVLALSQSTIQSNTVF